MPDSEKRSSARNSPVELSDEQRKLIGSAIIEGLLTPVSVTFAQPRSSGGGSYDQTGGDYTQSGGGDHDQGGGGGYNQSKSVSNIGYLEVTDLTDVLKAIERFRR